MTSAPSDTLKITVEFGGGAELLFDKIKKRAIELPPLKEYFKEVNGDRWTIRHLLKWLTENMLKERPELFVQDDTVRPGILVLINDADWELLDELDYVLQENDKVLFISTLHGG